VRKKVQKYIAKRTLDVSVQSNEYKLDNYNAFFQPKLNNSKLLPLFNKSLSTSDNEAAVIDVASLHDDVFASILKELKVSCTKK
jgi:hypothetical protein